MEVRQPMDITAEQLEKEGKTTIMCMKEHFKEYTSWSAWAAKRWPSLPDEYA